MRIYETIGSWDYVPTIGGVNPRPVALPGMEQCRVVWAKEDPACWPVDGSPSEAYLRAQVRGLVRPGANVGLILWDIEKGRLGVGKLHPAVSPPDVITALVDEHIRLLAIARDELSKCGQKPLFGIYNYWLWDAVAHRKPWLSLPSIKRLLALPDVVLCPAWYSRMKVIADWRAIAKQMYLDLRTKLPAAKIIPVLRPYYYCIPELEGQWIPADYMKAQLDLVAALGGRTLIFTEEASYPIITQRMLPWFIELLKRCL